MDLKFMNLNVCECEHLAARYYFMANSVNKTTKNDY